jgi:hypothetical protein
MRKFFLLSMLLIASLTNAQELNCTVTVNYDKITNANNQIFKTLQTSLNDFVNKTAWTEQAYKQNEKINCAMFITINTYDSNQFQATLQVQSSRPIYNSSYSSPVLNINDKDFSFKYVEFENLTYSPNSFDSNLMSVLAFYSYLIIGSDVESFIPNGGNEYFQKAQEIVTLAASSGYKGWAQSEGNQNKFFLINDILSPNLSAYKEFLFAYHFEGLDEMNTDVKKSKEIMKDALMNVSKIYDVRPSSYLLRTFFDAKSDEIVSIFSGGPAIPITDLLEKLNKVSPTNSSKWSQIKF